MTTEPQRGGVGELLTNEELSAAIEYARIRQRQTPASEPQYAKLLTHFEQLLAAQVARAAVGFTDGVFTLRAFVNSALVEEIENRVKDGRMTGYPEFTVGRDAK